MKPCKCAGLEEPDAVKVLSCSRSTTLATGILGYDFYKRVVGAVGTCGRHSSPGGTDHAASGCVASPWL